jgi:hypothetical protein
MPPIKFEKVTYEHLTASTVFWILQVCADLNIIIDDVCWYNKRNPYNFIRRQQIHHDPDENFVCQVTVASDNKKKLKFLEYLFYERKARIIQLAHCYNKEHKK